jgi:hypothetical protein
MPPQRPSRPKTPRSLDPTHWKTAFVAVEKHKFNDREEAARPASQFGPFSTRLISAMRLLRKHGILSIIDDVLGLEDETSRTMWRALRGLNRYDSDFINALFLTPSPLFLGAKLMEAIYQLHPKRRWRSGEGMASIELSRRRTGVQNRCAHVDKLHRQRRQHITLAATAKTVAVQAGGQYVIDAVPCHHDRGKANHGEGVQAKIANPTSGAGVQERQVK